MRPSIDGALVVEPFRRLSFTKSTLLGAFPLFWLRKCFVSFCRTAILAGEKTDFLDTEH